MIAAEAAAKTEGVTPEAVSFLAQVRARAYSGSSKGEIEAELSGLDKEEFIREVWIERLRELPFEMKLWDDIRRTRMYPVISQKDRGGIEFVNIIGAKNPNGKIFTAAHLLMSIPITVTNSYKAVIQNQGYK